MSQMDNCCGCGTAPGLIAAAVTSRFLWPGFAPFTARGPSLDAQGVRYTTLKCSAFNPATGGTIVKTISSNNLNSAFTDNVTGTSADADGPFLGPGLITNGATWPPDHISDTVASWDSGLVLELSGPVSLAWCKFQADNLLTGVDLAPLTLGLDSRFLTYDPAFVDATKTQYASNSLPGGYLDWLCLAVVVGPEDPPGSGSAPLLYAWGSITTQQIYTADTSAPFSVMKPFEFVAPAVENTTNSTDFPPAAFSADSYQQLSNWQERKCKCRPADGPFTGPVCCDTDYFLYQTVTPPPSTCEMHPITSSGELWLDPPIITADANDNAHLAVTTPWPGKSNIGGCPCQ